jgi:hypothetical protein
MGRACAGLTPPSPPPHPSPTPLSPLPHFSSQLAKRERAAAEQVAAAEARAQQAAEAEAAAKKREIDVEGREEAMSSLDAKLQKLQVNARARGRLLGLVMVHGRCVRGRGHASWVWSRGRQ